MLVLRIFGALLIVTLGISLVIFAVTKDRRWLRFTWQIFKFSAIILLILLSLFILERLLLVI
jgi:predicted membrane channel-forming protein YqfA (hemolysin III family)